MFLPTCSIYLGTGSLEVEGCIFLKWLILKYYIANRSQKLMLSTYYLSVGKYIPKFRACTESKSNWSNCLKDSEYIKYFQTLNGTQPRYAHLENIWIKVGYGNRHSQYYFNHAAIHIDRVLYSRNSYWCVYCRNVFKLNEEKINCLNSHEIRIGKSWR